MAKREMLKVAVGSAAKSRGMLRATLEPVQEGRDEGSAEHRDFPRARITVPFTLWLGEGKDRTFSATLQSVNISVSGTFLESTFFLPVGMTVSISFQLDDAEEPVLARAEVMREERGGRSGEGRSGMGLRFVEFFGQSELTLARLFLGEALREFVEEYLGSNRARSMNSEVDRVVDALAAWELQKVTRNSGDPWRPGAAVSAAPTKAKKVKR